MGKEVVITTLEELEKQEIVKAMDSLGGVRARAATALGISVRTLQRKLKIFGWQTRWPRRVARGPKHAGAV